MIRYTVAFLALFFCSLPAWAQSITLNTPVVNNNVATLSGQFNGTALLYLKLEYYDGLNQKWTGPYNFFYGIAAGTTQYTGNTDQLAPATYKVRVRYYYDPNNQNNYVVSNAQTFTIK